MSAYDEMPHDHWFDDFGDCRDEDGSCACAYFATDKCRDCREQERLWEEEMARLEAEEAAKEAAYPLAQEVADLFEAAHAATLRREAAAAVAAGGGAAAMPPPALSIRTPQKGTRDWSIEVAAIRSSLSYVETCTTHEARVAAIRQLFESLGNYQGFLAQHPKFRDAIHDRIAVLRADPRGTELLSVLEETEQLLEDLSERDDFLP
jgi:hypothetical protein